VDGSRQSPALRQQVRFGVDVPRMFVVIRRQSKGAVPGTGSDAGGRSAPSGPSHSASTSVFVGPAQPRRQIA
jgi:hypothetical protein